MDLIEPIYERQAGETAKNFACFLLYRNTSPLERSMLKSWNDYTSKTSKGRKGPYNDTPTAYRKIVHEFQWIERAKAYDDMLRKEQEENASKLRQIEQDEREKILTSGYALLHKRIEALDKMASIIEDTMRDDKKNIVAQWVTPDKVREYRGCLDDIAKELGERQKTKLEISGKDGGVIEIHTQWGIPKVGKEE